MTTTAEIEAAFNSIPTINLTEVVRIKTAAGEYDAEVLFKFAGSTQYAYTDTSGTIHIVRIKD
jgi:hypothetical protein